MPAAFHNKGIKLVVGHKLRKVSALCAGEVWPAIEGGGPAGNLAPHKFIIYFKEGGIGT